MERLKKFASDKADQLQNAAERVAQVRDEFVSSATTASSPIVETVAPDQQRYQYTRNFVLNRSQSLENPRDARRATVRNNELCPLCLELVPIEWAERHFANCQSEHSTQIAAPKVDPTNIEIQSVLKAIDNDTSEDLTDLQTKIKFLSKQG